MDDDKLSLFGPDGILPLLEAHGFRSTPENIQKYSDEILQIFEDHGLPWAPENMQMIKEEVVASFLESVKKYPHTVEDWIAADERWVRATTPTPEWAASMTKLRPGLYRNGEDLHFNEDEIFQGSGVAHTPEHVSFYKQRTLKVIHRVSPKPAGSRKAAYWHGPDGIEVLEPPLPRRSGARRRQQQNGRTR